MVFRKSVLVLVSLMLFSPAALSLAQSPGPDPLPMEVYKARRQAVLDRMETGTAVLYAQAGANHEAGFRSDSNFWYLTGINIEGAILILAPGEYDKEVLLLPPRDLDAERWTGAKPSLSEALEKSLGFDRVYRTSRLDRTLVNNMKHEPTLHMISSLVPPTSPVPQDLKLYRDVSARIPGISIVNSSHFVEHMRMIKGDDEVAAIQRAIDVTYQGLTDLIAALRPGVTEFQLDGVLEESFKDEGAQYQAFPAIVGSGFEATVLHYETRNTAVNAGELLLLDVGAEWDHYCADISRTLPVDGTFTPEQAKVYDVVLEAQKAAIAAVKPGVTVREVHEIARNVIRKAGYIDDFIHGTSHHLGLDVHDVADYGMPLKPGMVITIEPGIYLPDSEIGVRIEDDVLVTRNGSRVLSAEIPRTRADVEAWIKSARQ